MSGTAVIGSPVSGARPTVGPAPAPATADLLDLAVWRDGLEKYARAMHMAVVLTDADGRSIGALLNPRPLWALMRGRRPAADGECPLALFPSRPCSCVADALANGTVSRTRDRTGLVHFAVPLTLEGRKLGALVAGQVFDRFPEQLPLERAANQLELSPALVWQTARLEKPISPATLRVYEELLETLGRAFLNYRHHTLLETTRLDQLQRAEESLRAANDELERRVEERTAELRNAQQRAVQAERLAAVGQTVAAMAHESRNALQRSQSCLRLAALEVADRPKAQEYVARVQKAQEDLARLFEDVRNFTAPPVLNRGPCDLRNVWRESWRDLDEEARRRCAFVEDIRADDLSCVADPFRLGQAFRNLFDNALAVCGEGGRIVVRAEPAVIDGRPAIRVTIEDSGPGLTAEQREKLFDPFYTTRAGGMGLGLAITRRVVEAHHWTIVAADAAGGGAAFILTLPRGEL